MTQTSQEFLLARLLVQLDELADCSELILGWEPEEQIAWLENGGRPAEQHREAYLTALAGRAIALAGALDGRSDLPALAALIVQSARKPDGPAEPPSKERWILAGPVLRAGMCEICAQAAVGELASGVLTDTHGGTAAERVGYLQQSAQARAGEQLSAQALMDSMLSAGIASGRLIANPAAASTSEWYYACGVLLNLASWLSPLGEDIGQRLTDQLDEIETGSGVTVELALQLNELFFEGVRHLIAATQQPDRVSQDNELGNRVIGLLAQALACAPAQLRPA